MSSRVTLLEWDSQFFGVSIARAEIEDGTISRAVEEAVAYGVQCLYLFIPRADPSTVADAMRQGGRLVDLRVTLDLEIRFPRPRDVRLAAADDLAVLSPLARSLSRWSRFSLDPRFSPNAVASMYETWLERCMREGVVVVPDLTIGGFVGVRPDHGALSVDLVFVDQESRGENLAARLVRGALASTEGSRARVATQAWNVPAQRLYQEIGFRTSSLQAIVHLWLDKAHQPSDATRLDGDT